MQVNGLTVGLALLVATGPTGASEWQIDSIERTTSAWSAIYADDLFYDLIQEDIEAYEHSDTGHWSASADVELPYQFDPEFANFASATHESLVTTTEVTGSFWTAAEASAFGRGEPPVYSAGAASYSSVRLELTLTEPTQIEIFGTTGMNGFGHALTLTRPGLYLAQPPDYFFQIRPGDQSGDFYYLLSLQPGILNVDVSMFSDPAAIFLDGYWFNSEFEYWMDFTIRIVPAPTSAAVLAVAIPVRRRRQR